MAAVEPSASRRTDGTLLAIVVEGCRNAAGRPGRWRVAEPETAPRWWIMARNDCAVQRAQGWKLHISACAISAEAVLRQALGVLLIENAEFKVAASLEKLAELNNGKAGFSQIGKFITVYPNDDEQAVRLATALHEATRGLRGPAIPSDRPLVPGSLVYYRYGSLSDRQMQTLAGAILPAITAPEGELIPDPRASLYQKPAWAADPFTAAGAAAALQPLNPLLNNRYLVMATLYRSAGGAVARAIDIAALRRCVIKRAARDIYVRADGQDARDVLRHEAAVLACLAPDGRFPAVLDLFEQDEDLFLVIEDIAGETLEQYVGSLAEQSCCVPIPQAIAWGRELADALAAIHARGFVHRDLKLSNVIVTPEKRLRLIDFDLAQEQACPVPLYGRGTRGYASPQQVAGDRPIVSDDVYSFGALLYSMVTGVDPTRAPRPLALLDRPPALLNLGVGPGLAQLIARCLDADPARRFLSMAALDDALAAASASSRVTAPLLEDQADLSGREDVPRLYRAFARRLGDALYATVRYESDAVESQWPSANYARLSRDLYDGRAGALLALAQLSMVFEDSKYPAALAAEAHHLLATRPFGSQPLPGLYIGEAGIATALLRAGQALGDEALISAAIERGRWIGTLPYASPDLLLGTAGRLRFHLLLWDATAEREQFRYATQAGEMLLAMAEDAGAGGIRWTIPSGYDHLSGRAYCGFAHGAAGIGDALLDLFEASGDERFLGAAQGAARWLARLTVPALEDRSGLNWPQLEGMAPTGASWHSGAAGIGQFFLHAAVLGATPAAADLAAGAARTVARGARWADPTQAHGLAGAIEFILDMSQATGDHAYVSDAYTLARLLEAWMEEREGALACLSTSPDPLPPSYMVGYAGVALCLLRLSGGYRRFDLSSTVASVPVVPGTEATVELGNSERTYDALHLAIRSAWPTG